MPQSINQESSRDGGKKKRKSIQDTINFVKDYQIRTLSNLGAQTIINEPFSRRAVPRLGSDGTLSSENSDLSSAEASDDEGECTVTSLALTAGRRSMAESIGHVARVNSIQPLAQDAENDPETTDAQGPLDMEILNTSQGNKLYGLQKPWERRKVSRSVSLRTAKDLVRCGNGTGLATAEEETVNLDEAFTLHADQSITSRPKSSHGRRTSLRAAPHLLAPSSSPKRPMPGRLLGRRASQAEVTTSGINGDQYREEGHTYSDIDTPNPFPTNELLSNTGPCFPSGLSIIPSKTDSANANNELSRNRSIGRSQSMREDGSRIRAKYSPVGLSDIDDDTLSESSSDKDGYRGNQGLIKSDRPKSRAGRQPSCTNNLSPSKDAFHDKPKTFSTTTSTVAQTTGFGDLYSPSEKPTDWMFRNKNISGIGKRTLPPIVATKTQESSPRIERIDSPQGDRGS